MAGVVRNLFPAQAPPDPLELIRAAAPQIDLRNIRLEKIPNQKERDALWANDYQFERVRTYHNLNKIHWRCSRKRGRQRCYAKIHTDIAINEILFHSPHADHCHPDWIGKEVMKGRNKLKAIARVSLEPTNRMVQYVDSHLAECVAERSPMKKNSSRVARRIRNKIQGMNLGRVPLQRLVVPDKLANHPHLPHVRMLLYDSGPNQPDRIMVFATQQSLDCMVQYPEWYSDGTFRAVTRIFKQLYSIHVRIGTKLFPVAIALMSNMSTFGYVEVFEAILALRPQLANVHIRLTTDFEQAVHLAMSQVFANSSHSFCFFHFKQNLWRQTQAAGLQRFYQVDRELAIAVKMFAALAFVPPAFVVAAYCAIVDSVYFNALRNRYGALFQYVHYFERHYIGVVVNGVVALPPVYDIAHWNCYERVVLNRPRTNNGVEGFNRTFNGNVEVSHAEFWRLVDQVKGIIVSEQYENLRFNYRGIVPHPNTPQKPLYRWLNRRISQVVGQYFVQNNNFTYLRDVAALLTFKM